MLSKEQLKKVKGGCGNNCWVVSYGGPGGGGAQSSSPISEFDAYSIVQERRAANDGYQYTYFCN